MQNAPRRRDSQPAALQSPEPHTAPLEERNRRPASDRGRSYANLKSAEARLDRLTSLSVIEFVAPSLITTSDPTCDIALESAA